MKKIILLLVIAFLLIGCTLSKQEEIPKDCKCNRIVEVSSFNMQGQYTFGTYITINDCTGVQKTTSWTYSYNRPKIGDCR